MLEYLCPTCHRGVMSTFFDMTSVPVYCNLLWPSHTAAVQAPRGDIRLGFCPVCGMIYNTAFDPRLVSYTQAYENSLHGSPRFQAYATALATRLVEKYRLRGKEIIEIGCGRGEFLTLLCRMGGNRGLGFDPSDDSHREAVEQVEGLTLIRDQYFGHYADYAADLICCRHVLEHIPTPRTFLASVRQAAEKRATTVVFFEVPNVIYTLQDRGIWDIIYEHCSYFSMPSLTWLFQEVGFAVQDVHPAFGGQFLCLEAIPATAGADGPHMPESIDQLARDVATFGEIYRNEVEMWQQKLNRLLQQGCRIVVWGAGSKGVTFLNTVQASEQIHYVVDINPHKQTRYVAGTGQQIVPPAFLQAYRPDVVLVMNPLYQDEIRTYLAQLGLRASVLTTNSSIAKSKW